MDNISKGWTCPICKTLNPFSTQFCRYCAIKTSPYVRNEVNKKAMTVARAMELLGIELQCVERSNKCDRVCSRCDLVQDPDELKDMYEFVIEKLGNFFM